MRGFREKHLAAVASGCDAGCAVDVEADVTLAGEGWLARMESHSHAQLHGSP